jgi:hypothetical protein
VVESINYSVDFSASGLLGGVTIKEAGGGADVDILDTQKLRIVGFVRFGPLAFDLGRNGNPPGNERDFFQVDPELTVSVVGPVRVIRREYVEMILYGTLPLGAGFNLTTYFYPYSGGFGGSIDTSDLPDELVMNLSLVRQSLDLSAAAVGMSFHNAQNSDILVDGIADSPATAVTAPGLNWNLVTGDQGTLLTILDVPALGATQSLYYWDDSTGGSGDGTHEFLLGSDTGEDSVSYGDVGVVFEGEDFPPLVSFDFNGYFLPANQDPSIGPMVQGWNETGVGVAIQTQAHSSGVSWEDVEAVPETFALAQNYPNPFNPSTAVRVALPVRGEAMLRIVDSAGRSVRSIDLSDLGVGIHVIEWNGSDDSGASLPSGVYLSVLEAGGGRSVRKMTLIR